MKEIKFTTISGRTLKLIFDEFCFFEYFKYCGCPNLKIQNMVSLYLNNIHSKLLDADVPFDSALPQTVEYEFSDEFKKQYKEINDMLKYNL